MKYVFKENITCIYSYFGESNDEFEAEKKRNEGITFGRFEVLRSILVKNTLCLFGHEFRRRGLEVWVNGDFRLKRCFRCRSIMLNEIEFNNL